MTKQIITLALIQLTVTAGSRGDKTAGIPPTKPEVIEVPMGYLFTPQNETQLAEILDAKAGRFPNAKDDLARYRVFKLDKKFAHPIDAPNPQSVAPGVGTAEDPNAGLDTDNDADNGNDADNDADNGNGGGSDAGDQDAPPAPKTNAKAAASRVKTKTASKGKNSNDDDVV